MPKTVELKRRRRWRGRTKLYALGAFAVVSALIYWEQAALLYIASTLFICVVLVLVAFGDLQGKERQLASAPEGADTSDVPDR